MTSRQGSFAFLVKADEESARTVEETTMYRITVEPSGYIRVETLLGEDWVEITKYDVAAQIKTLIGVGGQS